MNRQLGGVVAAAVACAIAAAAGPGQPPGPPLTVTVLSSRPDMVSGGDALVEVRGATLDPAAGRGASDFNVTADGRDVTAAFHADDSRHSLVGLVNGLDLGPNTIVARAGGATATLEVTNFPITGPIVSGKHLEPYRCDTVAAGLGEPLDADCSANTRIEFFYRSTSAGRAAFKPLADPSGPLPADVARTTTSAGQSVPYVVRVESGTIDRGIYRIATLAGRDAWNRRLVFTFRGGCGLHYSQGINHATDVLVDPLLQRGFAVATSTELTMEQHCNDVLSAEAVMMLKEHIIERYGVPVWTIGAGDSGGAIEQFLIAQNFPWLLDGLLPSLAFPDAISIGPSVSDCRLLINYFRRAARTWTPAKQLAVEGYAAGTCSAWDKSYVDATLMAHPMTERAGRPLDNVGVQYGLKALNEGAITKAEFLDLNARIGGFDANGTIRPRRTESTAEAVEAAYATGRVDVGGGALATIPIIEFRSYTDNRGDIHDRARDFAIRARLRKANGHATNQVLWVYPSGVAGLGQKVARLALDTMTEWLDRGERPKGAVDACWDVIGTKIVEPASPDGRGICNALYPLHTNPRLVAGAPASDDVLKCQLKPINPRDYRVAFTPEEMLRLHLVFPSGVCDYSKPGTGQATN